MWESLENLLKNNQFASGGLLMVVVGGLMAYAKSVPGKVWSRVYGWITSSVIVYDESDVYKWMKMWAAARSWRYRKFEVYDDHDSTDDTNYLKTVAQGTYYFFYKGRLCTMSKNKEEGRMGHAGKNREYTEIVMYSRNAALIDEIIIEAKKMWDAATEDKVSIYTADGNYWREYDDRPETLPPILPGTEYEDLVDDINAFLDHEEWFKQIGVQYKRGYLFYGPPGTGKTTCVLSLARELKRNIYILNLADERLSDNCLLQLISNIPKNGMLVIEEIDCAKVSKQRRNIKRKDDPSRPLRAVPTDELEEHMEWLEEEVGTTYGITLSTLLNVLDGQYTPHGLLFFMTTNHVEKLDAALVRSSRVDYKLEFHETTKLQIEALCRRIGGEDIDSDRILAMSEGKSMSDIQDILIKEKFATIHKEKHERKLHCSD